MINCGSRNPDGQSEEGGPVTRATIRGEVAVSESVRAGNEVTCVLRDSTGEFLLLGADDDLRRGVRCRNGGCKVLAALIDGATLIAELLPGQQVMRSPGTSVWHPEPASDYSRIEYDADGEKRWIDTDEDCALDSATDVVFASLDVLAGGPVLCVIHDLEDTWIFWGAADLDADTVEVSSSSWESIASCDPSLLETNTVAPGWLAIRDSKSSSWRLVRND